MIRSLSAFCAAAALAFAQKPENVLVVVNEQSALSKLTGEYYARKRSIPAANVCRIKITDAEEVARDTYNRGIARPVSACLAASKNRIFYIVTTAGVPLKIDGAGGQGGDQASVDSELTLLYRDRRGQPHETRGMVPNPFFNSTLPFDPDRFAMYLVTRLAGYDFADIRGLIDRALAARNTGRFVIDMKEGDDSPGEDWLRDAAIRLPTERTVFNQDKQVLYDLGGVIGYASWGSNDPNRHRRMLGFKWLPGAIATEFVSTNGRTFARPPDNWTIGTWKDKATWFAGAPQTLTADLIHEGVTGASGHVYEPYLQFTPHPDILLPAYYRGRNLAESFYLAIPAVSWQNIVIGDPLCSLGKP